MAMRNGGKNGNDKKKPAAAGNGHKGNAPFAGHIPSSDPLLEIGGYPTRYTGPAVGDAAMEIRCDSDCDRDRPARNGDIEGITSSGDIRSPVKPCNISVPVPLDGDKGEKKGDTLLAMTRMVDILLSSQARTWIERMLEDFGAEYTAKRLGSLIVDPDYVHKVVAQRVARCSVEQLDRACSDEKYARELGLEKHGLPNADCPYWEQQNDAVEEKTAMVLKKAQDSIERLSDSFCGDEGVQD